jgi:acyl carrier protein
MTKEAIFEKISDIIKEQLHNTALEITLETTLQDDLAVDSIAFMEFIINLEDEFKLDIPDEDVENMQSIDEIVNYLYHRLTQ